MGEKPSTLPRLLTILASALPPEVRSKCILYFDGAQTVAKQDTTLQRAAQRQKAMGKLGAAVARLRAAAKAGKPGKRSLRKAFAKAVQRAFPRNSAALHELRTRVADLGGVCD